MLIQGFASSGTPGTQPGGGPDYAPELPKIATPNTTSKSFISQKETKITTKPITA